MAKIVDLRPGRTPARANRDQASLFTPKAPKKPVPLRARRRRARLAQIILVVVLLLAGAYALHALSYLPAVNIGEVDVQGAHELPAESVSAYVRGILAGPGDQYFSRSNIFLYPRVPLERDVVANFPRIESASVSRPSYFSRTLLVVIHERDPYARWCSSVEASADTSGCFAMDQGGFIFAAADASTTPAGSFTESYIFSGGISTSSAPVGQTFIAGHLSGLLALLAIIQQQTGLTPRQVVVVSGQDFSIEFAEGFELKASFGAEASTLARNLKLVLSSPELTDKESKLEYIDLRFGDRVFYKLKGETATTSGQ